MKGMNNNEIFKNNMYIYTNNYAIKYYASNNIIGDTDLNYGYKKYW